ncbi:AAA family ATPase [Corynebacterium sp. 13CS0277]|uniref:ATP-binding protein n=1 Tax=Corynebacterium sp. 13CS0277 TaxID=2071994 RepID=UPI000D02DBC6|nr:DUF4143 domain-containing protein [Corynebacterium sp. 13CS0277]PRQ11874.1 AAA family ATPase [Corynebacterium sp. 13CS0277]
MSTYRPRVIDAQIRHGLSTAGAVEIHGVRGCGKTTTGTHIAAESLLGEGPAARFIDDWHQAPQAAAVRHALDDQRHTGQFLLASSTLHAETDRVHRLLMRTMTWAESGDASGDISIRALLAGEDVPARLSDNNLLPAVRRIVVGGWPGREADAPDDALARNRALLEEFINHDFPRMTPRRRLPGQFAAYLASLAGLAAQSTTKTAVLRRTNEGYPVARTSLADITTFQELAERMHLLELLPAWSPELTSAQAASTKPTYHLADPSLAAALLGAGPERLLAEPRTLGFLFLSQVVHDVRVFADALGARGVYHYRDHKRRDVIDIVVESSTGAWIAINVALSSAIERAAQNLLRVTAKMRRAPTRLVVVVPSKC